MNWQCYIGDVLKVEGVIQRFPQTNILVYPGCTLYPLTYLEGEICLQADNTIYGSFLKNVKTGRDCEIGFAKIFGSEIGQEVKIEGADIQLSKIQDKTYIVRALL